MNTTRIVWLDVTRLMAMFLLVCCHCADPFNFFTGDPSLATTNALWGAIYGSMLRPCVPLFVMITGALLLPVRGDTVPFYKKRIQRVLYPFLIWSVLYNLFPWLTGLLGLSPHVILDFFPYSGEQATQDFLPALRNVALIPLNFSVFAVHMWYIYLLIGLYLFMPIFSAWVEQTSERGKRGFLLAWVVTLFLPYYYIYVSPYVWGSCSWNSFGMLYGFAGFGGYLLLGHYLRNRSWTWRQLAFYGLPMLAVGYAVTFIGFRHITADPNASEPMVELFFTYCSTNVVMLTVPLFMLSKKIRVSQGVSRLLANLTLCGFGIYMIHYFFVGPCVELTRALNVPISLQIPVAAVVAFSVSWIIVALLHRLLGKKAVYLVG